MFTKKISHTLSLSSVFARKLKTGLELETYRCEGQKTAVTCSGNNREDADHNLQPTSHLGVLQASHWPHKTRSMLDMQQETRERN